MRSKAGLVKANESWDWSKFSLAAPYEHDRHRHPVSGYEPRATLAGRYRADNAAESRIARIVALGSSKTIQALPFQLGGDNARQLFGAIAIGVQRISLHIKSKCRFRANGSKIG